PSPQATASMARATLTGSRPDPPYSGGITMPRSPSPASLGTREAGNLPSASHRRAWGRSSRAANSRMVSLIRRCSSVYSNRTLSGLRAALSRHNKSLSCSSMRGSGYLSNALRARRRRALRRARRSERRGFDRFDLRNLLLEHPLHAGLERHHRVHAPDTRSGQPDLHDPVHDIDELQISPVLLNVRTDPAENLLDPAVQVADCLGPRLRGLLVHARSLRPIGTATSATATPVPRRRDRHAPRLRPS